MKYFLVFAAVVFLDFCWAAYVAHIGAKRPHQAAAWATAIMLGSAFATVSYVEDRVLIIPAMLGAYVGTYFAVRNKKD